LEVEFPNTEERYVKKTRFSEEQIVRILKEVDAGVKVAETCRKYGISDATWLNWKAKYAGMDVSQLRRLIALEAEHAKLKRMYAELALNHHALQDVVAKKLWARSAGWSWAWLCNKTMA
jgi:putative transposase